MKERTATSAAARFCTLRVILKTPAVWNAAVEERTEVTVKERTVTSAAARFCTLRVILKRPAVGNAAVEERTAGRLWPSPTVWASVRGLVRGFSLSSGSGSS